MPVFDAIRRTPRTAMRDEYEITTSIQILVDDGFKIYPAEVYCNDTVISANVAPITTTISTDTALTRVAFPYAKDFGIKVFKPTTTRTLMYLLSVYDLLNPQLSSNRNLFAKQVHGGVFTNPWSLASVMRLASCRRRLGFFY